MIRTFLLLDFLSSETKIHLYAYRSFQYLKYKYVMNHPQKYKVQIVPIMEYHRFSSYYSTIEYSSLTYSGQVAPNDESYIYIRHRLHSRATFQIFINCQLCVSKLSASGQSFEASNIIIYLLSYFSTDRYHYFSMPGCNIYILYMCMYNIHYIIYFQHR